MRNPVCLLIVILILAVSSVAGWAARGTGLRHDSEHGEPATTRTTARYDIPDVRLVRSDGHEVGIREELNDGRPVVMNFVFTTCTTICPLSSSTFQRLQTKLGPDRKRVHLVSISIDPEEDTPQRLTEYAKSYNAGPGWSFYTGTVQAILDMQRAFGAYRGDKMNHTPLTLMRSAPGNLWIRLEGFPTPDELALQVRAMMSDASF